MKTTLLALGAAFALAVTAGSASAQPRPTQFHNSMIPSTGTNSLRPSGLNSSSLNYTHWSPSVGNSLPLSSFNNSLRPSALQPSTFNNSLRPSNLTPSFAQPLFTPSSSENGTTYYTVPLYIGNGSRFSEYGSYGGYGFNSYGWRNR